MFFVLLHYSNAYCTKKFFTASLPLLEAIYYVHLYFLKTVQSFPIIFSQMFLVLFGQLLIQKSFTDSRPFAESFWGSFWWCSSIYSELLKPFFIKVCKDVFCITSMLTALKKNFTASPPLLEAILGYFLVFCHIFRYFLRTVWFLMKF